MSATILKQQKLNSLRKKDTMWIYKNPQGLLILEDELNERRKKRSARHRSSPPLPQNLPETNKQQQQQRQEKREKDVLIAPAMKLESPKDVLIPIAEKVNVQAKPTTNILIEPSLKKPLVEIPRTLVAKEKNKQPEVKRNLIQERTRLFATTSNKVSNLPVETQKATINTTSDSNFLLNAKLKLSSVQQKIEKNSELDSPVPPPRRKGLVSSFVSAFETPNLSSPGRKPTTQTPKANITNPKPLLQVKPTTSQSYSQIQPSRLASHSPTPPVKPQRRPVMPSPTTTVSSPVLSTPSPIVATDSYFPVAAVAKPKLAQVNEPEIKISPSPSIEASMPSINEISVYLPQLSPEISFQGSEDTLDDVSEQGSQASEDVDDDEPLDKLFTSISIRPEIKKRVSFSEQLTYIPEQLLTSDDDSVASPVSEPSTKNPMLDFSRALSYELSDVKTKLIAERKVNTTPSRDRFVPAVVKKTEQVNAPQKLSNKLLDMFQQKLSKQHLEQQQKPLSKPQPQQSRELVHLTKSRPRKPPSLKKPTYPAATAQPNWRMRATNRKYEFIA